LVGAHDEQHLLRTFADLAIELGRFPVSSEMRLKRRRDSNFPNDKTFYDRFGSKARLARAVMDYCATQPNFASVVELCRPIVDSALSASSAENANGDTENGYVYLALMKVGREKRYKIGKADIFGRRTKQVSVNLPEELELIHAIATDDPYGIETYWQKRFECNRRGGEWFVLTAADVKTFKKRKFM
jgi:hypothetical protein